MMGTGAWGWAVVMMAIPVVLLIVVLLAALGGLGGRSTPARATSPLDLLDARYASGELSHDEYLRIRTDLVRGPSHPGGG